MHFGAMWSYFSFSFLLWLWKIFYRQDCRYKTVLSVHDSFIMLLLLDNSGNKWKETHEWEHEKLFMAVHSDGLVHERCNSIVNALESCLSCTNPSIWLVIMSLRDYSKTIFASWLLVSHALFAFCGWCHNLSCKVLWNPQWWGRHVKNDI